MTELCILHPDESAVGRCVTCGRAFCSRCRVDDLATDRVFCSEHCRAQHRFGGPPSRSGRFVEGLHHPVRTGWKLAAQQAGPVTLWVGVPVGLVYGLLDVYTAGARASDPLGISVLHQIGTLLCAAIAAAAVGVQLSNGYRGAAREGPWLQVAQRLVVWALVWIFFAMAVLMGTLLLIVPGMIFAARLFWADEFALIHDHGPAAAVRESLALTKGLAWRIMMFQLVLGIAQYAVLIPVFLGLAAVGMASRSLDPGPATTIFTSVLVSVLLTGLYAAVHAPEIVYFYGLRELRTQIPAREQRGDFVAKALRGSHSLARLQRRR